MSNNQTLIAQCEELQAIEDSNSVNVHEFIIGLLAPNVDARLFEITFNLLNCVTMPAVA